MPNQTTQHSIEYLIATSGNLIRKYPYVLAWNRLKKLTTAQTRIALYTANQKRAPKNALFFDAQESKWYTIDDVPELTRSEIEKLLPQMKTGD